MLLRPASHDDAHMLCASETDVLAALPHGLDSIVFGLLHARIFELRHLPAPVLSCPFPAGSFLSYCAVLTPACRRMYVLTHMLVYYFLFSPMTFVCPPVLQQARQRHGAGCLSGPRTRPQQVRQQGQPRAAGCRRTRWLPSLHLRCPFKIQDAVSRRTGRLQR